MMAKIAETREESITGITYTHWDIIEVWETRTHTDEVDTNDQIELGTDVIRDAWLGMNAVQEETDTEIF